MNFKALCPCGFALLVGSFFFDQALAQTPSPTTTPITINQTNVPIRVDGHLNDWPEARMIYLGWKDQVVQGKNFWKGEDDFNGRVFITYDEQYLYLAAIVQKTGDIVNSNDLLSLWNGDCVELLLSTRSNLPNPAHLARGDYHIGLSPGPNCKLPQIYCFNTDQSIPGSRLVVRKTLKGYLMEASIPLSFFQGLTLGQNKGFHFDVVLDKGGQLSGYRIVQMDYAGKAADPEDPSTWLSAQWAGNIEQAFTFEQPEDLYAGLVHDGTGGATYAGLQSLTGLAQDSKGKPLAGVLISTWPKTKQALTDSKGLFELPKIKVYDKTVLYGRLNGYGVSLAALELHAKAVTMQLNPFPAELGSSSKSVGPFFFGQSLSGVTSDKFGAIGPWLKALNPGLVRLNLTGPDLTEDSAKSLLDQFVAYVRQIGAEPLVALPIDPADPETAAQWVHYANVEKNYKIRLWTLGDEPDRGLAGPDSYNAYDYINDFRTLYNAAKREDPAIVILGPELASKYGRGENDWMTPFLRYDGDIVEGISIHRYASLLDSNLPVSIRTDLNQEGSLVQALRDKVSQNTDYDLPLVVTAERACAVTAASKSADEAVSLGFWEALWEADKKGSFLNAHMALDAPSYPWEAASAGVSFKLEPAYWALKLWGQMIRGRVVPAQVQDPKMSVYATQDPKTKDVSLLIINKGDRYWRPKFTLNGENTDLSAEAGLDQRYDFEIPSFSISCLRLKADRSPGEATIYTLKMAKAGQEPLVSVLKPW